MRYGSEYAHLKEVLLHLPGSELDDVSSNDATPTLVEQYGFLETVDQRKLRMEILGIAMTLASLGIRVRFFANRKECFPNLFFMRDLVAQTPWGPILARPTQRSRWGEETEVSNFYRDVLKRDFLFQPYAPMRFEASDLLWLEGNRAILGVGKRTNREGANGIERILLQQEGFKELHRVPLRLDLPQHLLGGLLIYGKYKALYRLDAISMSTVDLLKGLGYTLHDCTELPGVKDKQAMNLVVVNDHYALGPDDIPEAVDFYRKECDLEIIPLPIDEIRKAGGGLACVVQPMVRGLSV